jgi:hypothetical protein
VLVISQRSHAGLNPELKAFWDNETWRNRLIFLCGSETFTEVSEFVHFIFTAQTASWRDLVETAARHADWYFVPPGGLETMKSVAIRKDVWRDEGAGYLRRGPFPKEKTSVVLSRLGRNDTTGRVVLQVSAKHGDRVYYEEGGSGDG